MGELEVAWNNSTKRSRRGLELIQSRKEGQPTLKSLSVDMDHLIGLRVKTNLTGEIMSENMYQASKKQWNVHAGCEFDCRYCRKSFQAQAKRQKHNCIDCYNYKPHFHEERLSDSLPVTLFGEFIFTCASGDIASCNTVNLEKIKSRILELPAKTFLIQSKDPKTFSRVVWPTNVILGTTLETNRDAGYDKVSKAPKPSERFKDFLAVNHPIKMVTIEPIMKFDLAEIISWIEQIQPRLIWMGYDSKNCGLSAPTLAGFRELHWELAKRKFVIVLKTLEE